MRDKLFAHLQMWRPYTLGYAGLVGLAGAMLADPRADALRLIGAWAVPTLAWLGAHYGGDYFDRELDAIEKPQRPIPSGRVAAGTALAGLIVCVSAGGVLALLLNYRTLLLVAAALMSGIGYSKWLKGKGIYGNLIRGTLTAYALLFGSMAVQDLPPLRLLPIAAAFCAHDAFTNLVGTLRDASGDRLGGYQTFVVRHGEAAAIACIAVLYGVWSVIAVVFFAGEGITGTAVALLALSVLAGCGVVAWLANATKPVDRRTALRAHEVLVVERTVLAGAFIAAGGRAVLAVTLTTVVLAITIPAQLVLRGRYELPVKLALPVQRKEAL